MPKQSKVPPSNRPEMQLSTVSAIMPVGGSHSNTHQILVVDDEPNVAFVLQRVLSSLPNSNILAACHPIDALKLFQEHKFDLVLLDYHMPHMDGFTLAAEFKQLSPTVSIIMLTANEVCEMHQQLNGTVQRVLLKPISPHQLRSCIASVLNI